jgi:hypothetical protein
MSALTGSVYGWLSERAEDQMDIDRRSFLAGGLACASLAVLPDAFRLIKPVEALDPVPEFELHPFTRSLIDTVSRSDHDFDLLRVERLIRLRAETLGYHKSPVMKWLPDSRAAFDYLRRYELADLLRMENATLWREEDLPAIGDDTILDRWCATRRFATEALRPDDRDRALMAPKLEAKRQLIARGADLDAIFEVRAMTAQVSWLETSISAAAVGAISNIDLQLAQGLSEVSVHLHHQLLVIEAYQHGLLATWETPAELICVPRSAA